MSKNSCNADGGGPTPGTYDTSVDATACCTNQRDAKVKHFAIKNGMRMCDRRSTTEFSPSAVQIADVPRVCTGVSFLSCPYSEKDMAKKLGAKWDVSQKSWYVPSGVAISPFARWLPGGAVDTGHGTPSALAYGGKRTVVTTTKKAERHAGWWEHHMQAGTAAASAFLVSIQAATTSCLAAQRGFCEVATTKAIVDVKVELEVATEANAAVERELAAVTEANSALKSELAAVTEWNVAMKAELVAATETITAAKEELAAATEANAVMKLELAVFTEAIVTMKAELVAAFEAKTAAREELVAVTEANAASTTTNTNTAVNTAATASIVAAFTTAAIAAIAISTVAISIAMTFDSPTLHSTDVTRAAISQSTAFDSSHNTTVISGGLNAPEFPRRMEANAIAKFTTSDAKLGYTDGETSQTEYNAEGIAHNRQVELQLVDECMRQQHESNGAAAAFVAAFAPLDALAREGGFDLGWILDDCD